MLETVHWVSDPAVRYGGIPLQVPHAVAGGQFRPDFNYLREVTTASSLKSL